MKSIALRSGVLRPLAALCRSTARFPGRWRIVQWSVKESRAVGAAMGETTVTTGDGFRFTCDLRDWIGQYVFVTGTYEEPTAALMSRMVRPGDTVVDVGANVGYFTLLLSHLVGPTGRVHAFEPMPHALERLKAHLAMNRCQNVTLHECAVGSTSGTTRLYLGPRHHTSVSSLMARDGAEAVDVHCTTLDDALAGIRPTLVKVDVEGWESEVMAGAKTLLDSPDPPRIIAEVSDPGWTRGLQERGFTMFAIGEAGPREIVNADLEGGQFNALFCRTPLPAR